MLTLSYGYKKPQSGDSGSVWFPALEDDITQLNAHTHNGTNSAKIPTASLTLATQAIASGSWSATSGGTYRQSVAISGSLQYDNIAITMKNAATGDLLYLTIEKIDSTHYYVYINDNSLDLTAVYGI